MNTKQKVIKIFAMFALVGNSLLSPMAAHAGNDASLGGSVYVDTNRNGVHDESEPGIPGVKIKLECTTSDGTKITKETMTDENGWYFFYGLPPSTCTLTELNQPEGYQDGPESIDPWIAKLSGGKVGNNSISDIHLGDGWQQIGYHFGELNECGKTNSRPDCLPYPVESGPALPPSAPPSMPPVDPCGWSRSPQGTSPNIICCNSVINATSQNKIGRNTQLLNTPSNTPNTYCCGANRTDSNIRTDC